MCCTCMALSPCAAPACQKEPQWTHTSQHHLGLVSWTPTWQTWVCWTAAQPVLLLGQLPADLSCLKPGMHHLASSSQPCNKDKCVALAACRIGKCLWVEGPAHSQLMMALHDAPASDCYTARCYAALNMWSGVRNGEQPHPLTLSNDFQCSSGQGCYSHMHTRNNAS